MGIPLGETSQPVAASAAGRAVVQVQPLRAFEVWDIANVSIQSTSTLIPTFKLYRSSESPSTFIAGTYTATFNSRSEPIRLENGERLLGVFENCTPGATCVMTVTGSKSGRV